MLCALLRLNDLLIIEGYSFRGLHLKHRGLGIPALLLTQGDKHYQNHTNRFHTLTLTCRERNIKHYYLKEHLNNLRYKIFHMYCCFDNTQRRRLRSFCLQLSHFFTQNMKLLAHCFIFMFPFKLDDKEIHVQFRMFFAKTLQCCTYL